MKSFEEIERCNTMYPEAEHIYHVPMLPETLEMASFLKYKGLTAGQLFVGLEEETVRPLGINRRQMNNLIIIADPKRGKTNAVRLFLQQLNRMDDARIAISDSEELAFAKAAADQDWMYLDSKTDIEQYVDQLENDLQAREEEIREHMQTSLRSRPEIIAQYPVHYLVIDGLDGYVHSQT
ncbi:hypothetical protein QS257_02595 [Terrilactibacillus sp. S3-3]|nr:hypothetical protein QS257_02595 [Terrilactibacillus sp. S3-3]